MIKKKSQNPYREDHYDLKEEVINFDPFRPPTETAPLKMNHRGTMGDSVLVHSKKWHRIKRINNWMDKKQRVIDDCIRNFDILMNEFKLPSKIKEFIKNDIIIENPANVHEMVAATFKSIERNNFPITTTEFREKVSECFSISKDHSDIMYSKMRDYTWYINRILSNIEIRPEFYNDVYQKVKENFLKLQPVIKGNPTTLISVLCRLGYISLKLEENIPKLEKFLISGNTYGRYREIFRDLGIKIPKHVRARGNPQFDKKKYHKKYYEENKEKIRKQQEEYFKSDVYKTYRKRYYQEHKEEIREKQKKYNEKRKGVKQE